MSNKRSILLRYRNWLILYFTSVLLLGISQFIFYLYNRNYFNLEGEHILSIIQGNMVFLLSSCSMCLSIFTLLFLFPVVSFIDYKNKILHYICSFFWIFPTILMLIINLIDTFWYPVIGERSTYKHIDVFLSVTDKFSFVLSCIKTYWIGFIVLIGIILLGVLLYSSLNNNLKNKHIYYRFSILSVCIEFTLLILVVLFMSYTIRGKGRNPLRSIRASKYVSFKNMDIVLNSPYTLIKTLGKSSLKRVNFFSQEELSSIYNPQVSFPTPKDSNDPSTLCLSKYAPSIKNIVFIQMESMSAEYLKAYGATESWAPFLDSLIKKSISYQGWANGSTTKEAPISVVSSFPNFSKDGRTLLSSNNFNTKLHSIAKEFKKISYDTLFFFGDENGSQYIDSFARIAGFDSFYGKNEYDRDNPGNKDFLKGSFGLLDEPFLQYVIKKIDSTYKKNQKPFLSYLATSTAHFPFLIPQKYQEKFSQGPLSILQSIRYSDYALEQFFKKASLSSWYEDTLFILFADHTSESSGGWWSTDKQKQAIPLLFYIPKSEKDTTCHILSQKTVQQIDIFPTLLDMFKIKTNIITYGTSLFDSKHKNTGLFYNGVAHLFYIEDYLIKCIDNCNSMEIFNVRQDPLNKTDIYPNISKLPPDEKRVIQGYIELTKATVQQFINRMIDGNTTTD